MHLQFHKNYLKIENIATADVLNQILCFCRDATIAIAH